MNIKFSVIVPNYNHSIYLVERLESIFNQSYDNYEVILLDDCSTDDSINILDSYKGHPKTKILLRNEVNSGSTFIQWERGIKYAEGEFIWIAESDDYSNIDFLSICANNISNISNLDLICTRSFAIDEKSIVIDKLEWWFDEFKDLNWSKDFLINGNLFISNYFAKKNLIVNASGVVFRKSKYTKVGGVDKSMKLCADWLLWMKIIEGSQFLYISNTLNYFRFHTNTVRSKEGNSINTLYEQLVILKFSFKFLKGKITKMNHVEAYLKLLYGFHLNPINLIKLLKWNYYLLNVLLNFPLEVFRISVLYIMKKIL